MTRPIGAFALLLVGGILIVVSAGLYIFAKSEAEKLLPPDWVPTIPGVAKALGDVAYTLGLIWGILVIVGAMIVYTGEPESIQAGSVLGLIFGLLSLLTVGGGFYIGFILSLVGAVLGLIRRPPATTPT
jgi:hypothetical protein